MLLIIQVALGIVVGVTCLYGVLAFFGWRRGYLKRHHHVSMMWLGKIEEASRAKPTPYGVICFLG
jgi:hypothetical protein